MEETFCHFLLAQLLHGMMITILDQQYKEYTNCKSINMIFLQIVPTFYMFSASCCLDIHKKNKLFLNSIFYAPKWEALCFHVQAVVSTQYIEKHST